MKQAGSILVTNTMIIEASKFVDSKYLDEFDMEMWKIARFFDFCSLVEACVLHEHLVTLEGTPYGDMKDYQKLSLRLLLKNEGVLLEKVVPFDPSKIQRKLVAALGSKRVFSPISDDKYSQANMFFSELLPEVFSGEAREEIPDEYSLETRYREMFFKELGWVVWETCPDLIAFLLSDNLADFIGSTGGYDRGAYALRTFLYYGAATENRLSFFPDYPRIPFFDSIIAYINDSVVMSAYKLFADKLHCEAEDFLRDASPIGLPIPPFTSILLNRCKSVTDVGSELLVLREEYRGLRDSLIELEKNRAGCTNIKERNAVRARIEKIFKATSRKFERSGYSTFKSIAEFGEDVSKPFYNPYNPLLYGSALLLKPVEWLQNWWHRRPLAQLFNLAGEVRRISEYDKLVKKVFRIEFDEGEINTFKYYQTMLGKMFRLRREE